jgi:hypothetical protein
MFISQLLRQRHLAHGVEQLEFIAIGQRTDTGEDGPGR